MEMAEIGRYVGKRVHVHGGGTDVEGHLEHVQTVTYTAEDCDHVAREILDGYVVVIDGKKLEFTPGAQFEVLDGP